MRRWLFRLAYNRYKKMTFEDDIARLNELITLFKRTDWFQTIYHPRAGRRYALKLWYINAQSLRDDLVAWQDSLDVEDPEYIAMEDYTYALLENHQPLYRWLTDTNGRVLSYTALMDDVVTYGRVLATWLDALKAREDNDAKYGIRKTRKITHDCCELLTFAADRYVGAL